MTEREKIIALAKECGIIPTFLGESGSYLFMVEAFYKAAQNEAYEKALNALDPDKYPNECDKSMVHNCKLAIRKLKEQS